MYSVYTAWVCTKLSGSCIERTIHTLYIFESTMSLSECIELKLKLPPHWCRRMKRCFSTDTSHACFWKKSHFFKTHLTWLGWHWYQQNRKSHFAPSLSVTLEHVRIWPRSQPAGRTIWKKLHYVKKKRNIFGAMLLCSETIWYLCRTWGRRYVCTYFLWWHNVKCEAFTIISQNVGFVQYFKSNTICV